MSTHASTALARRAASEWCVWWRSAGKIAVIEKTRSYNGVYHVLHGTLSPLHGVGPEHLGTDSLLARVAQGEVEEVILGTNPTVEGEATAVYLADLLRSTTVRVTRIATGVPAGSDVESADEVTMTRAMEGRRELKFLRCSCSDLIEY